MDSNYELKSQIIDMADTTGEAVLHIQLLLKEGNIKNTYYIMRDILNALEAIDDAFEVLKLELVDANYQKLFGNSIDTFDNLMDLYESNSIEQAIEYVDKEVVPKYFDWKKELVSLLKN